MPAETDHERAEEILADARRRRDGAEHRAAARPKMPADERQALHRRQKTALTRARNSGDRDKVVIAVKAAVDEWNRSDLVVGWPDDWPRWQAALSDVLHFRDCIDLSEL